MLSGNGGIPGFADKRNSTSSRDLDSHREDRAGHRQGLQSLRHGAPEAWRRLAPRRQHVGRCRLGSRQSLGTFGVDRRGPLLIALQGIDPLGNLAMEPQDIGQCVAVLAAQVVEELSAGPRGGQPFGIVGDLFGCVAECRADVVELGQQVVEPLGEDSERGPASQRNGRCGDDIASATVGGQRLMGHRPGRPMLNGARQRVFEHFERLVLVRILECRCVELGELETRQVELTRPGAIVTAESRQLGIELGNPRPCLAQPSQVDPTKGVEGDALAERRQQPLVGVLAVQIDEVDRCLGECRSRCRTAVDVGAGPTVGGNDATEHDLAVVAHEPRVDARFGGTRPDDDRVRPPTDDQVEGLDKHRLAGAGFAADRCQPIGDDEVNRLDDPEVLDVQLAEHEPPSCPPVEVPSGSCWQTAWARYRSVSRTWS